MLALFDESYFLSSVNGLQTETQTLDPAQINFERKDTEVPNPSCSKSLITSLD